ncbi:MAG: hypothetical protein CMJ19_02840 [Phycisphaeraceae bacterium]|nr:hypothetical protein [Phycisphaeraceae bacterium]
MNPKNSRFKSKYLAIQKAFKQKYEEEGKRTAIIWKELEEEFFLSPARLQDIVRMGEEILSN